jgi:TonB family protein
VHAVVIQSVADSHLPEYPKKARKEKIEGVVRLDAEIAPDGKVESVRTIEGSLLLEEAASKAIRKWTFHPVQREGKPVEDRLRLNVKFRLDGEQVRAQVERPEDSQSENSAR